MAAEKDIIVALELATTSIRAIAGQRMADGTIQVLAFADENASNCIRKGIIDNIDKTTQAISRVLGQISIQLGKTISRLYVGIGGQSVHSVQNKIKRPFAEKTQITNDLIDQLMDTNRGVVYTDSQILEVVPQEYKVGTRTVPDIVGMQVENLEATFLNIIARSSLADNIEKCIKEAGYEIAEMLITPITLTDTVLNASEKRSGCALVDIGADTTTVCIYSNNLLRKLAVIPLGGNNVTMDIAKCTRTEFEEAENLKTKYGRAILEDYDTAQHNKIQISHDRETSESNLCEIIEARYEEILLNAWAQIEDDSDKLTSGIIFTGGGAQIRFLTEAFQRIIKNSKQIRVVKGLPKDISFGTNVHIHDHGRINNILSLLLHGDQNCVVHAVAPEPVPEPVPEPEAEPAEVPQDIPSEEKDKRGHTHENAAAPKKHKFWEILKKALTDDEDEQDNTSK